MGYKKVDTKNRGKHVRQQRFIAGFMERGGCAPWQDISVVFNEMRYAAIDIVIRAFADKWCLDFDEVRYEDFKFRGGELANENQLNRIFIFLTVVFYYLTV